VFIEGGFLESDIEIKENRKISSDPKPEVSS
jgi:hypothetical protein